MEKSLKILLSVFLIVTLAGIVNAAKEQDTQAATGETAAKNMTYGQCVSQFAAIKNTCYKDVKDVLATCKAQAAQDTATKKTAVKQCDKAYKQDKKNCKAAFKTNKKEDCAKIKHNFLETLGSAFK